MKATRYAPEGMVGYQETGGGNGDVPIKVVAA